MESTVKGTDVVLRRLGSREREGEEEEKEEQKKEVIGDKRGRGW